MNKKIMVGDTACITRIFTKNDVSVYSELSEDKNPVHLDDDFAANSQFGQCIVHGMLVSSLFSALLGQRLPGEGSIYMGQNLKFKAPVFLDMKVIATVAITDICRDKPIVSLSTVCTDVDGNELVSGDAVMYVPKLRGQGPE